MNQNTLKVERRIRLWIAQQEYDRRRAGSPSMGQSPAQAPAAPSNRSMEMRES